MGKSLKVLHFRRRNSLGMSPTNKPKEELYEEMLHNDQLFKPGLEKDNEAKLLQPDQIHRTAGGFRRRLENEICEASVSRNRSKCAAEWKNYKLLLLEFAQWAFGPNGFPNLQYIACGNFMNAAKALDGIVLRKNIHPSSPPQQQQRPDLVGSADEVGGGGGGGGGGQKHPPRFRLLESTEPEFKDLMGDHSDFFTSLPFYDKRSKY